MTEVTQRPIVLGPTHAELAAPATPNGAGVILYPTIRGVDAAMRRFAADLAGRGLTALVWDPYDGAPTSDDVKVMIERSRPLEDERCIEALRVLADHLLGECGVKRLGGVGWCFGGRIGLLQAGLDPRVEALCVYNPTILPVVPVEIAGAGTMSRGDLPGQTMDEFALAQRIAAPVQVTRPQHDFTQPAEYQRLIDQLFARPVPTFYEYYPGVGHGFSYVPDEANARAHAYAWANTLSLLATLEDER